MSYKTKRALASQETLSKWVLKIGFVLQTTFKPPRSKSSFSLGVKAKILGSTGSSKKIFSKIMLPKKIYKILEVHQRKVILEEDKHCQIEP